MPTLLRCPPSLVIVVVIVFFFCFRVQVVKVTGVPSTGMTRTILMRGSNRLVLDEAERSVHDALCVVRSLVRLGLRVVSPMHVNYGPSFSPCTSNTFSPKEALAIRRFTGPGASRVAVTYSYTPSNL